MTQEDAPSQAPPAETESAKPGPTPTPTLPRWPVKTIADAKREAAEAALAAYDWNVKAAAKGLRCSRATLYRLIERYQLRRPDGRPVESE